MGTDDGDLEDEEPLTSLMQDHFEMEMSGGVPLERTENNALSPAQFLQGGEHFDETDRNQRRQEERVHRRQGVLPRDKMHETIAKQDFGRPTPTTWKWSWHSCERMHCKKIKRREPTSQRTATSSSSSSF